MPTQCQIRKDPFPHLYIRASGQLLPEEYFQALKAVTREEDFCPHFPTLLELGPEAEPAIEGVDFEETEKAGAFIEEVWGSAHRRVAIAGGPPDTRSFIAMTQKILNESPKSRTFASVTQAKQWLFAQADRSAAEHPAAACPT